MEDSTLQAILSALESVESEGRVKRVFLGGIGEPMLHPRFTWFLRELSRLVPIIELQTNGSLLDGQMIDFLIDAGLEKLVLSYETGSLGHAAGGNLEKADNSDDFPWEMIERVREAKARAGKRRPLIAIEWVLTRESLKDLNSFGVAVVAAGVDEIIISNMLPVNSEEDPLQNRRLQGWGGGGLPNGIRMEGPENETGWAFGAHCGVNDLLAICEANYLCNDLGIDTISAGVTVGTAMELYEKGFIPAEDIEDGPELKFGSSESVVCWTNKLGKVEGKLGKLLAKGSYRMAEHYGHPEFSMSVKKQELPVYDPRGVQGHGLQYATSNRGGCHVKGYMISPEVLGVPEKLDPQELKGKPQWVIIFQDLTAVIDATGLCLFTSFALGLEDYADLINASAGFNLSPEETLKIGSRIWNMERKFNMAAGIDPSQDTLPKRMFEPLPDGTIPESTLKDLGLT